MKKFDKFLEKQGFRADACKSGIDPDFYRLAKGLWQALKAVEDAMDRGREIKRYEKVRKLSPRQFAEIWDRNIKGEGTFDELVDALNN